MKSGVADIVQYLAQVLRTCTLLNLKTLLQVTSPAEFKKTALEESLKAYCDSFNSTIDQLGGSEKTDVKYCTMLFLMKEMHRLRLWGAMFAIDFIIER